MVSVFREVRRVLRDDGTIWVNMGDSYATDAGGYNVNGSPGSSSNKRISLKTRSAIMKTRRQLSTGLKPKDLIGMPWRLAFALQADGWFLRCDIIWHKPNPMPESVSDRPTKSHEYLFLLSKSERYFYDAEAIKEPVSGTANPRRAMKTPDGWGTSKGMGGHGSFHRLGREDGETGYAHKRKPGVNPKSAPAGSGVKANESFAAAVVDLVENRNKRSVWTVPTFAYPEAHFATYPPALIKPCILAGTRPGDIVLDPFGGSGTTGEVAIELGRSAVLLELNPEYAELARARCCVTPGLAL